MVFPPNATVSERPRQSTGDDKLFFVPLGHCRWRTFLRQRSDGLLYSVSALLGLSDPARPDICRRDAVDSARRTWWAEVVDSYSEWQHWVGVQRSRDPDAINSKIRTA